VVKGNNFDKKIGGRIYEIKLEAQSKPVGRILKLFLRPWAKPWEEF
jgi:hypothetical protein